MNRVDTKKLYLGVYTTDGKHIPVRIITLIKTQDNKWKGCLRKTSIIEKCDLDDIAFYTFNGKAIRRKSVRKNPDNIGFVITDYDMKDLTYEASSFHEYELREVDNILMNTTWDHFSDEVYAKEEFKRSEYVVDSKLPYERSIDGIPHWGYCMEAKIIGPSEKYPGCTVLQRKYALIDEEFAKSIIFSYCKESLDDNDLLEDI